ncbi:cytochrome P450 7B1 [Fusarium albosuccineum]|uniref:Cytochrome P450 7B1 n=1 Tax=Fusarium albosuccineum TaxID=1237068 RepID=A0A8H4LMR6_9HYPO|nr:cytochrome P450 7B1 [Fusarium albosuccineum]
MDGLEVVRKHLEESLIPKLQQSPVLSTLVTVLVLLVTTRFFTGGSSTFQNGSKSPVLAPYWVPYFGHAPRIFLSTNFALTRFRNRYTQGIFSIKLFQSIHSFIFRPSLAAQLLEQPDSVADKQDVVRRLMVTNFGLSKKDLEAYDKAAKEVYEVTQKHLAGSHLDELSKAALRDLDDNAAELVSFNSYPTDQMDWERLASADVLEIDGRKKSIMEVNFIDLVKNFVAKNATSSVFGTDFVENFPDIWPHLWVFNDGFSSLAMGIPLWAPLPTSQRARIALGRLLVFMREYHDDLEKFLNDDEPGPRWQDFHTISQLVLSRTDVFRKHKLSLDVRAAFDVALLWSVTANSTSLISWALFELYQDPILLTQVREEVAPFVEVIQPKNEFGGAVWIPPKIEKLELESLMTKCPLLQAVYLETQRLYGGGWSVRHLKEDVTLKDSEASYVLKKGTYAHFALDLHHSDPRTFTDARVWQVSRYLEDSVDDKGAKTRRIDPSIVRASDGTLTMCDDSAFTLRKVLLYTSVLTSLYDVEPAGGGRWSLPSVIKGVASSGPSRPTRLWVKRREPPQAK